MEKHNQSEEQIIENETHQRGEYENREHHKNRAENEYILRFDVSDKLAKVLDKIFATTIKKQLDRIEDKQDLLHRSLQIIMGNQAEFDAKITAANTALDAIGEAIAAESAQIQEYIDANPGVDTSALDGVVTRLEAVSESVGTVFEPAPEDPEDPPVDPPA